MKKKMLVIPGPFVPYNDTLTLLNYKRLAYLDLSFDVLAIGAREDESIKRELANDENYSKFNVKRILDYKKMDIVRNPFCLPYFIFAYFKYRVEALKLIKNNEYDYLYTASHPGMVHLIGKEIKRIKPNIKWFASFSDPIKGSPYKNDPEVNKRSIFYQIAFKIGTFFYVGDYYEEAAVKNADNLVFICEEQRDFTCGQYKDTEKLINKSMIIPLSIDDNWQMYRDLLLETKKQTNKPLIASHLGRVYGLRKIDEFLLALKELKEDEIISSDIIVFNQYDEIDEKTKQLVNDYNLGDIFKIHEKVSYKESIEIMKDSDILLLFDSLMPKEKIQPYLPSKIAEYLILKKPILALCGKNSPSYRIINKSRCGVTGETKEELKQALIDLISETKFEDYNARILLTRNNIMELNK